MAREVDELQLLSTQTKPIKQFVGKKITTVKEILIPKYVYSYKYLISRSQEEGKSKSVGFFMFLYNGRDEEKARQKSQKEKASLLAEVLLGSFKVMFNGR